MFVGKIAEIILVLTIEMLVMKREYFEHESMPPRVFQQVFFGDWPAEDAERRWGSLSHSWVLFRLQVLTRKPFRNNGVPFPGLGGVRFRQTQASDATKRTVRFDMSPSDDSRAVSTGIVFV